jgi:hypothetical protein
MTSSFLAIPKLSKGVFVEEEEEKTSGSAREIVPDTV